MRTFQDQNAFVFHVLLTSIAIVIQQMPQIWKESMILWMFGQLTNVGDKKQSWKSVTQSMSFRKTFIKQICTYLCFIFVVWSKNFHVCTTNLSDNTGLWWVFRDMISIEALFYNIFLTNGLWWVCYWCKWQFFNALFCTSYNRWYAFLVLVLEAVKIDTMPFLQENLEVKGFMKTSESYREEYDS